VWPIDRERETTRPEMIGNDAEREKKFWEKIVSVRTDTTDR
jgi:hypothetical protein